MKTPIEVLRILKRQFMHVQGPLKKVMLDESRPEYTVDDFIADTILAHDAGKFEHCACPLHSEGCEYKSKGGRCRFDFADCWPEAYKKMSDPENRHCITCEDFDCNINDNPCNECLHTEPVGRARPLYRPRGARQETRELAFA